jgi:hypothetical protein
MKREASRLLSEEASLEEILGSLTSIKRAPERASASQALKRLATWRAANPGELMTFKPATYAHTSGLFKVTFTPDFGIRLGRTSTAVHIWNTAQPAITARTVYSALSLFPELYEDGNTPDDFALLSLREPKLYRLSEAGRYASLGESLAEKIAEGFRKAIEDAGRQEKTDQPIAPNG